ncbi:MAG: hypothetical protein HY892_08950 [Deltaproteobacteria bacterium]|nr:hypothetical protein [Deltaproteobacteria bacterium]
MKNGQRALRPIGPPSPLKVEKKNDSGGNVDQWYGEYWGQTWYKNSFLVRRPEQIAQARGHDREWNNIHDSGCNFTCLAMMVGVDPARLSSAMAALSFFFSDRTIPARYLTGRTGGLVWDQNEPYSRIKKVVMDNFWHSKLGRRTKITIQFKGETTTADYPKGKQVVIDARGKGHHIICGSEEHSYLVAGSKGEDFFLWDPDDSKMPIEEILAGRVTLRHLFEEYAGEQIEFLKYRIDIS